MKPARKIKISLFIEDLPDSISGMIATMSDDDPDSYVIAINRTDDADQQRNAFLHEMCHIWNHDLEHKGNIQKIEARTHQQMDDFTRNHM